MTVDELNDCFALPGFLSFVESPLGGPVARLATAGGMAEVALKGAHVLAWQPADFGPALYLSPATRLDDSHPIRGGVPVCWPWFATHPTAAGAPNHGTVRTRPWRVARTQLAPDGGSAAITLSSDGTGLAGNPLTVSLTVTLSKRLMMTLETQNHGATPETLPQALHTYFSVSDISNVRIEGLEGHDYLDKLDNYARKPQAGAITFDREVDRIYLGAATPAIVDDGFRRRITVDSLATSRSTVVWNPWIEKTLRLGDMPAGGYRSMVCVETGNVADDAVVLLPGGTARLTASLSIARG